MDATRALRVQGRDVSSEDLRWIERWIETHPEGSRYRLRRELCLHWNWRNSVDQLKTFAARSLLEKLHQQGFVRLPPIQEHMRRVLPWSRHARNLEYPLQEGSEIQGSLAHLQPIELRALPAGSQAERRAEAQLARFHYRGLDRPVGTHLYYVAFDRQGRELAVHLLGAAAWRCAARDRWIGWNQAQREERLAQIVNHARFLILPWVKVPHLASHLLGLLTRQIVRDWHARHRQQLLALETFVEKARFSGTSYRAANWQRVGQTQGRSRQDRHHRLAVGIKDVYLFGLQRNFMDRLRHRQCPVFETSPPCRTSETSS